MRTLTVCTLALLALPHLFLGSSDIPNLDTIGHLDSSLGVGHTFLVYSTPNILVCMEWCHRLSMCHSVDLNRERSECRLNVKSSIQDPKLLKTTIGSIHVDKEKFRDQLVFDACHAHSCDKNSICVSGVCVPVFSEKTCGLPPTVANAEPSPPGPFPVGHTHNYNCTVDYLPFYEPYATCQDNGKWTDVVFQCQHLGGGTNHTEHSGFILSPAPHVHSSSATPTITHVSFMMTCQDNGIWTDVVF